MARGALPLLLLPVVAGATVLGGGSPVTDCYVALEGVTETASRHVDCADGSACDLDGRRDAVCTFDVSVCVNVRDRGCGPRRRVTSLRVIGAPLDLPPLPSLRPRCGAPTRFTVPVRTRPTGTARSGRLKLKLIAKRDWKPRTDRDAVTFTCVPDPCPDNPSGPKGLALGVTPVGSDVDVGWSGAGHNMTLPRPGGFPYCLSDCAGAEQTCAGEVNPSYAPSSTFTLAPTPVVVAGVPLCLQPTLAMPSSIRAGATSGDVTGTARLEVAAYSAASGSICPRCGFGVSGTSDTCDSGPAAGASCTATGLVPVPPGDAYAVSTDCPPSTEFLAARVAADVFVTTGTTTLEGPGPCPGPAGSSLPDDLCDDAGCGGACVCAPDDATLCRSTIGGVQQTCCVNDASRPCFPTGPPALHQLVRIGAPVPPPVPPPDDPLANPAVTGSLAGTACLVTEPAGVSLVSGLDGPVAVVLPLTAQWLR